MESKRDDLWRVCDSTSQGVHLIEQLLVSFPHLTVWIHTLCLIPEKELVWHRDKENRLVEVLEDTDWYFQMDNRLPIPLKKGIKFNITKETFHRVIKGTTDLVILIEEY